MAANGCERGGQGRGRQVRALAPSGGSEDDVGHGARLGGGRAIGLAGRAAYFCDTTENLALLGAQIVGHRDLDLGQVIAAPAVLRLDARSGQAQHAAAGSAGRDGETGAAAERLDLDRAAERGDPERDGDPALHIESVARELGIGGDAEGDIEVARRAGSLRIVAAAAEAEHLSIGGSRVEPDAQGLRGRLALTARGAPEPLVADGLGGAARSLEKTEVERETEVLAAIRGPAEGFFRELLGTEADAAAARAPAEGRSLCAEEVGEDVAEAGVDVLGRREAAKAHVLDARPPPLIVGLALRRIAQHLVGVRRLLETFLGRLVPGVLVRVVPEGEAAVGLLDVLRRGIVRHLEHLVVVPFSHGVSVTESVSFRVSGERRSAQWRHPRSPAAARGRPPPPAVAYRRPAPPGAAGGAPTAAVNEFARQMTITVPRGEHGPVTRRHRTSMDESNAPFLTEFLSSAEDLVARLAAELETLRADAEGGRDLTPLLRGFHSLKGNSSFIPDCPLTPLAHAAEDAIEAARDGFVAPARLLEPLRTALDCCEMRLAEYRRAGTVAPMTPREGEIAAALARLATADGERAGITSRYFFAGADVTDALGDLHQAELGRLDPIRLDALRDRLRELAAAGGASGSTELDRDRTIDPRALMRWLAERAVRVPVAKGSAPLLQRAGPGWEAARGELLPRHFTIEADTADEFLEHAVELRLFGERLARLDRTLRELVEGPAGRAARTERTEYRELDQLAAELRAAHHAFAPLAARLQERLLAIRRVPVKRLLDRHAALIRDLAPRLGKEVTVAVVGGAIRADKSIVEQLEPPLTHLVRNAVDHGLETPAERAARSKAARGSITLRATSEGQWFVLEVADDGAGIDATALRRSAVERGFLDGATAAGMTDEQIIQLVFLPGLSARREVNELSGRGVGMDEVFATVRQLRGTISIDSERGQGTRFIIKVPDTGFAVVRCVPVRVGELRFLIPHDATRRWTEADFDPERDGPLLELAQVAPQLGSEWLERGPGRQAAARARGAGRRLIVVLESGGRRFALHLDEVGSEMDVVVRPLDRDLVRASLWSMAALGAAGETQLVLDVDGLAALLPVARVRPLSPVLPEAA